MALTAAQVWYVAIVYPKRVSASEASDADVLNDLALLEPSSK